ncbi:MAG: mechanosensitive ion channel [Phycisphaeraceae bacterium]|nr:mechanosensitive ion channel [Phycisphaeraceae bacterium]
MTSLFLLAQTEGSPAGSLTLVDRLSAVWNYEVYSAAGSAVKLNQILIALLIVICGILVAKVLTQMIARRLSRLDRLNRHAAHFIQKIFFYVLVVIITLVALPLVGIPITIFAVIGGAVAIGVGFGAQNLCNNLISGLIIMLERPIRLGDIVEVDDHEGQIEEIGNRCTRVRRSDGIDLLVPNSSFLEQTVINWTLSDADVRGKVSVGVMYGSPTEQVRQILMEAATSNQRVLKNPEPVVIFEAFGDNALIFDLYFWSRITRPMDLRKVHSELRFAVDAAMRQAGIVIAYPQRDVHLDSLRPIEVKMIKDES